MLRLGKERRGRHSDFRGLRGPAGGSAGDLRSPKSDSGSPPPFLRLTGQPPAGLMDQLERVPEGEQRGRVWRASGRGGSRMAEGTASGVPREAFQPGDLAFPPISWPRRELLLLLSIAGGGFGGPRKEGCGAAGLVAGRKRTGKTCWTSSCAPCASVIAPERFAIRTMAGGWEKACSIATPAVRLEPLFYTKRTCGRYRDRCPDPPVRYVP